jgi:DNA-binding transcriptional MerR regulator
MTELLTIGEFARLTHLSVKTLHHYHDVGLIVPITVDPRSGYRRYSAGQLPVAHVVRRLRGLDMPVPEVKAVLDASPAARHDAIAAHLRRMETELDRTRELVGSLRRLLEDPTLTVPVEERTIGPTTAFTITRWAEHARIGEWCAVAFAELDRSVAAAGAAANGIGGALYPPGYFEQGADDVEAFLPVAAATRPVESVDSAGAVAPPGPLGAATLGTVPGGRFAVALHHGSFADLDRTYGALGTYVASRSLAASGAIREHYIVSPGDTPDPDEWRTEVCWPVEPAADVAGPAGARDEGAPT